MSRAALFCALAAALCLVPAAASAHGFHPGSLVLEEREPGRFSMAWTAPVDTGAGAGPLSLDFPDHCRPRAAELHCGPAGLFGAIAVRGLGPDRGQVAVWIRFLDGAEIDALLTGGSPRLEVDRPPGPAPAVWTRLGATRALADLAPLAAVLGLVLVAGARRLRRLAAALAAFAAALALGLALVAAGIAPAAAAPAGALVAASALLFAREALGERATLTRRAPCIGALGAGGACGLALGAALADLGAPAGYLALAGAGALAALLGAAGVAALFARAGGDKLARLRPAACYALGGLGVFWLVGGALAVFTAGS